MRKLAFMAGLALRRGRKPETGAETRPPMALAYTAFGYFSLMIVLALLLPGH